MSIRKKILKFSKRAELHLSRPPRLEGKAKNAGMRKTPKSPRR